MTLKVHYLGHSGFVFSDDEHRVVVDPFLTDNPKAVDDPEDLDAKFIALTHGHFDHVGDTVDIAKRNDATVYGAFELVEYLAGKGVRNTEGMNPGGRVDTPFGWVALTHAFHSSSHDGTYTGNPCGVVLNIAGYTIYHLGDTGLFSDLKLFGEIYKPDIACIPIGDRFTMGPELAARAAELVRPKYVIPVHYNTWPPIEQDPRSLQPSGIAVKILAPGETWEYTGERQAAASAR